MRSESSIEITRDNLLSLVEARLESLGVTVAELERRAGLPKDTVRDFKRGKTYMLRSDKYQRLMKIIAPEMRPF